MFIHSHKKMSEFIYSNIESQTSFSLNKFVFKTGNMSPDLPIYHRHLKHYKHQNFSYIVEMINDLSLIDPTESTSTHALYSYRLGVIAHYVCDYFCLPHHDREYYEAHLPEHLLYEKNLHKEVKNYSNETIEKYETSEFTSDDLIGIFDVYIAKYHAEENSFEKDINYAINAASMVCSIVVAQSLKIGTEILVYA
ncbi:MAG: zinc dependent phospholipase C family protein [Proteocatella sp.]